MSPRSSSPGVRVGDALRGDRAPERQPGVAAEDVNVNASVWIWDGILTGMLGAAVIAVFFLAVDIVQGRPLWTPYALGSAVFLGESVAADAAPQPDMVLAYTMLHAAVFLIAGLATSFALLGNRARLGPLSGVVAAVLLFAGFEAFFLVFFSTFADSVASSLFAQLGTGRIAVANLLAAGAMAATSLRPPLERRR